VHHPLNVQPSQTSSSPGHDEETRARSLTRLKYAAFRDDAV